MVMIQLMSMSSYADNKLQMCSITNISVDVAKCGENFTNLPSTLTILCYKKWLVLTEQSIQRNVSTHYDIL